MKRRHFVGAAAAPLAAAAAPAPKEDPVKRRRELYALLGDLPPRDRPVSASSLGVEERDGFLLERLTLDLNGHETVPAYFVKPAKLPPQSPAILFNHWHAGEYKLGKDEILRPKAKQGLISWAKEITGLGWSALCIDHWCFGDRSTRTEADTFKEMLWKGQVMWGMMVYDSLKALDYLVTRPEVDPRRVATLGMSMGSTMAWWIAALDTRLKVCVDICCLTDFDALLRTNNLKGHGFYYYVPALLKHFTTSQINSLIVPRPHLALAGNLDSLTPPEGLDRINRDLTAAYAAAGKPGNWKIHREDVAHVETPAMRAEAVAFLKKHL